MLDIKRLLLIRRVYNKYITEKFKQDNLGPSYAVFVAALDGQIFASQQELSEFIGCNKAHTSRMLIKMQLKGLIKPSCKELLLTNKGKEYAKVVKKSKSDFASAMMKNISSEDAQIFEKVLNQIFTNAKKLEEA